MNMKSFFPMLALVGCVLATTACENTVPAVPPTNRTVVGPPSSGMSEKPWNQPTESEGQAILGPLSNTRR